MPLSRYTPFSGRISSKKPLSRVLHRPDEQKTSDVVDHPTKRPLLLFVDGASGTYPLTARTDNAVYCVDCGGIMGDPFMGLAIKKGYFTVEHYGGSAQR
jgi:hypothetical protein